MPQSSSAQHLAPVYLDDTRVQLSGDPRPKVSKIVAAGGQEASGDLSVVLARGDGGKESPVRLDDVVDRSQDNQPIRLRCIRGGEARGAAAHDLPASLVDDESTGVGAPGGPGAPPSAAFGAARPGQAGNGAQGEKQRGRTAATRTAVRPEAQAKSDFTGTGVGQPQGADGRAGSQGDRSGDANQTYGAGDLAPGGRTGLNASRDVGVGQPVAQGTATGHGPNDMRRTDVGHLDSTQEFQSGGRQGEGGAPPHGATGGLRDQSTDHSGRQQGTQAKPVTTLDAKPSTPGRTLADASSSGAELEGQETDARRRKPALGSASEPAAGAEGRTK